MINIRERTELCFLFGICLFTFLPGMFKPNNDFILDDKAAILKNTDVVNISRPLFDSLGLIMQHDFWGQDLFNRFSHKSYRPIVTMIYHLEYRLYSDLGEIGSTMRANNLILHYTVCVGMKRMLMQILPNLHRSYSSVAVLLFAIHPIHTEVIYSIVGRADILCAFVFLIAVFNYCDIMTGRKNMKLKMMIPMALFGLVCMFSKEIGIVLLPFCGVLDIINTFASYPKSRVPGRRKNIFKVFTAKPDLIKRIIYLAGITFFLAIIRFAAMNFEFPTFNMAENPISNHPSFFVRALTYPYIHALHFWLLICPDWLCFDWSHNSIAPIESPSDPRFLLAIIFYMFLFILFIMGPSPVRIAVALIVIPFIPSSNIFSIGFVIAERVLYIPAMGYCLLISIGFHCLYVNVNMPKAISIMLVLIIAILIMKTSNRTFDYENEYTLYSSGLRVNPNNAKINYNVAQASFNRAEFEKAFMFGERANMLRPNHPPTLNNLANACRRLNKHELSIKFLTKALQIWPDYSLGWSNLGITYTMLKRYPEALESYLKAEQLDPNNDKTLSNLGMLYSLLNNEVMAGRMHKRARDLKPKLLHLQKNYLMNRADYGNLDEFIEACDNAEKHGSDNIQILMLVAEALAVKDHDFERIESILKRVIKLDPENFDANLRLSLQYLKRLNIRSSLKYFKRALQLNPTMDVEGYSDLMKLLEEEKRLNSNR